MKTPTSFGTSLCAALVAFAATACMSTKDSTSATSPTNEAEMQAKWMEFATPSSGHQPLQQKIGKWTAVVSMTMAPGAPPMQSTGTSEMK